MAMFNASLANLPIKIHPGLVLASSFPTGSFKIPTESSHCPFYTNTTLPTWKRRHPHISFAMKKELVEVDNGNEEVQFVDESREAFLYSFAPLPLVFVATLPGAATVRSLFGPFVELVKSWNLPDWLAVVLFAMGGYGTYLGFRIRFSDDIEEKAKAKDLHPKLLAGMFFFFALGATGGVTSLLTSDKPIFESPHAVTGSIGLVLLTIQTILPTLFEGNPGLRNVHGLLGSGIMTLFLIHAAIGLQLGLSY